MAAECVNAQLLEALRTCVDTLDRIRAQYGVDTAAEIEARTVIAAAEARQASHVQLIEALNKRCYMFSERHLSGYRIVLGFEAPGDADEVIDQLSNRWGVKNQPQPCGD